MVICAEYHLPHSVFLEWEPEDRAKAIAYHLEKNERCQLCGSANWEWDQNRFAYEAVETMCQGCLRISAMQETTGNRPGVSVVLSPTGTVDHAKRLKRATQIWRDEMSRKARQ
jgi:hypothetical protein